MRLWNLSSLSAIVLFSAGTFAPSFAAPSAVTAKKCMHLSYIAFPYKRPGAVKMTGDRRAYFKDCLDKDGNVPEPQPATH